jgi:hypothetical protein
MLSLSSKIKENENNYRNKLNELIKAKTKYKLYIYIHFVSIISSKLPNKSKEENETAAKILGEAALAIFNCSNDRNKFEEFVKKQIVENWNLSSFSRMVISERIIKEKDVDAYKYMHSFLTVDYWSKLLEDDKIWKDYYFTYKYFIGKDYTEPDHCKLYDDIRLIPMGQLFSMFRSEFMLKDTNNFDRFLDSFRYYTCLSNFLRFFYEDPELLKRVFTNANHMEKVFKYLMTYHKTDVRLILMVNLVNELKADNIKKTSTFKKAEKMIKEIKKSTILHLPRLIDNLKIYKILTGVEVSSILDLLPNIDYLNIMDLYETQKENARYISYDKHIYYEIYSHASIYTTVQDILNQKINLSQNIEYQFNKKKPLSHLVKQLFVNVMDARIKKNKATQDDKKDILNRLTGLLQAEEEAKS